MPRSRSSSLHYLRLTGQWQMRHSSLDSDRWCPRHASTDWEFLDASNESRSFGSPFLPQWSYDVPFQDLLERPFTMTYRARTNAALLAIQELLDESRDDVFATNWAIQVCWRMRSRPSLAPHLKNQKRNKSTSIDTVVQCSRREKQRKHLWPVFAVQTEIRFAFARLKSVTDFECETYIL